MPLRPDPSRAGAVLGRLQALRGAVAEAEDDVLACLVVTGEPRPQRVLDDWLDQVADTLRAIGEGAALLEPRMTGLTAPATHDPASAAVEALEAEGAAALEALVAPEELDSATHRRAPREPA